MSKQEHLDIFRKYVSRIQVETLELQRANLGVHFKEHSEKAEWCAMRLNIINAELKRRDNV